MRRPIETNGDLVLSLASVVLARFYSEESFDYYCDITDPDKMEICSKASKWTILHEYISAICYDNFLYLIRKQFFSEAENEMKKWMDSFNISYDSVIKCPDEKNIGIEDERNYYYKLLDFLDEKAMRKISDATFTILFQDKDFLYSFNQKITLQIRNLRKIEFPDYLEQDGRLKRENPPKWLRYGVYYRDRGRCQSCGIDLSSDFSNAEDQNYDHIIPLAQGGCNDPTNYQLLCEHCNKSKKDRSSDYRNLIWPYWGE